MKPIRQLLGASLLASAAVLTAAGALSTVNAADATAPPPPPPGEHGWHHHHGPWHVLGKLGLSDTQKSEIKSIFTAAKQQMQSLHEQMLANSQ